VVFWERAVLGWAIVIDSFPKSTSKIMDDLEYGAREFILKTRSTPTEGRNILSMKRVNLKNIQAVPGLQILPE